MGCTDTVSANDGRETLDVVKVAGGLDDFHLVLCDP
jgi:hypothetical protein